MDIHKPKTWRGPGEFFREYLIIVVGVLTALGGEQAVEWVHRQTELTETREALREEIAQNEAAIAANAALDHCRAVATERVAAWALGGPRPTAGTPLSQPGLNFSVWEVAKAGPLSRMPVQERLAYSQLYDDLMIQQKGLDRQLDVVLRLAPLVAVEQLNAEQAQRVVELSAANRLLIVSVDRNLSRFMTDFRALGIPRTHVPESRLQEISAFCQSVDLPAPTL